MLTEPFTYVVCARVDELHRYGVTFGVFQNHLNGVYRMNKQSSDFFKSLKSVERAAIAERCGIKRTYLNNLVTCPDKHPSIVLAAKIEQVTGGRITKQQLRPDIDWNIVCGTR